MAKVSLAVFVKSAFISRAVLFVVAFAMMSALLLAKPQSSQMSSMQTTEAHQHDNDASPDEHNTLLFHSHGNVHHLNADHSHDINKLFALTEFYVWQGKNRAVYGHGSPRHYFVSLSTPERSPRSGLV